MRYPAEIRKEASIAVKMGWTLAIGGGGHLKWFDPCGILRLVTSATPHQGKHGMTNARAELKRHGIVR